MPSAWQRKCYDSEISYSQTRLSFGMNLFRQHSTLQNLPYAKKSPKVSKSSIRPNPHAWPLTGPKMALTIGSFRNTASALPIAHSAAKKDGRSR
jgi:hypothetical protein